MSLVCPGKKAAKMNAKMLFFGCANDDIGHYLFTVIDGRLHDIGASRRETWDLPFPYEKLDGRFQPSAGDPFVEPHPNRWGARDETLGVARLHHVIGMSGVTWTIIAMWDRSVDKRGASCAAVLVAEKLNFDELVERCRVEMPAVMKRFPALTQVDE